MYNCFVCRDDSVVERAKFKEDKYRLSAEDWAKKHKRHPVVLPIVVGTRGVIPKQTVAGEVEGVGFHAAGSSHRIS